ncbi:MAG: anthranilate synthase component I, partial [Chloroflexi bacterium]|nr:anthranilate synthase component I [Chloroflexota bacterium]
RAPARGAPSAPRGRAVLADVRTPASAFLKGAETADHAFLFESVAGGEHLARYSFLGKDPFLVLRSAEGRTIRQQGGRTEELAEPFLGALRGLLARYRAPRVPGLPRFAGGAVGFLGYDTAKWFEPTLERARAAHPKPAEAGDDAAFMLFDTVMAFDHVKHRILISANAEVEEGCDLEACYALALARIGFLEAELRRQLSEPPPASGGAVSFRSNTTQAAFEDAVRRAKDYITAGDIFQVVLSQRFETEIESDPFTVYRALRYVNPSPYMYFIRLGGVSIVGSSPEMLVRVEGRRAETHPIAGTRPRGVTAEADARLADELRANEKERAEHVMLVDLGRNDLGRVSAYGSVQVPQYMALERYSHVMHLVSRVVGELTDDHDRLDALAACFPAGTVSGAPKIRAMEIIDELEPTRRGIYAGAVGYVDFAGHLDCCITIRTIVIRDGRAWVQAGAGIVADSDPTAEYEETRAKASALFGALHMAESGRGPSASGARNR